MPSENKTVRTVVGPDHTKTETGPSLTFLCEAGANDRPQHVGIIVALVTQPGHFLKFKESQYAFL